MAPTAPRPRQAFFARFSHQALRSLPPSVPDLRTPLILLTGGLRTPALLHNALVAKHAHLLGIGRGAVLCPDLPQLLKQRSNDDCAQDENPLGQDPDIALLSSSIWTTFFSRKVSLLGAGVGM